MSNAPIAWAPQAGPQKALVDCPYPLVGFGGARGGGKTDGVLGKWGVKEARYGARFNGVFFRREMPQADDLIERAREIYEPCGARFQTQLRQFVMPNGGRVRFRPLENDADAAKYQGQNLTDAAVEEAGNYPKPDPIFKLFGALRSSGGVPIQLLLTFNPGGTGHHWLKQKFIKPAQLGLQRLAWQLGNGKVVNYTFIPSKVGDNRILLANDPGYIDRLHMVGSPELVRAWLEGDWEIHEGSYFPEFSQRHIIPAFKPPKHWTSIYSGYDHGYNSPWAQVFGVVSSGKWDNGTECVLPDGRHIPKGAIVIYREAWGTKTQIVDIAGTIVRVAGDDRPVAVADPSIWAQEGGPSINDQFKAEFAKWNYPTFKQADNDRISGWSQIRRRLAPDPALLFIMQCCPYLIETLPALAIDPKNPEDCDTTGEDHAPDALRYLCKERVLESTLEAKIEPVKRGQVLVKDYIDSVRREAARTRI